MLGELRLVRQLASGNTSVVFLARRSDHVVVVKLPHRALTADHAFVEAFVNGARAAISLQHPNTCELLEVGVEQGAPFLVQEHVRGRSLHDLREMANERRRRLPVEAAVHIVCEALSGLDFAHRALAAAHLGVSPHAVLIGDDGEVKLNGVGMGPARAVRQGVPAARLPYVAPEQVTGAPVGQAADIFAAGVMVYELLHGAGGRLWPQPHTLLKMRKTGFGLEPLGHSRPGLPSGLESAIDRALRRDPADRYATAEGFAAALRHAIEQTGRSFGAFDLRRLLTDLFAGEAPSDPEPPVDPTNLLDVEAMAQQGGADFIDDDPTLEETRPPFFDELGEITLVEGGWDDIRTHVDPDEPEDG